MATIQRPVKTYGTRNYVAEVAAAPGNEDPILASEVDGDLDTIYAAWNGGVDSVNIKSGSVTYAKLAPDAQLWQDTGTALTPGVNFANRSIAIAGSAAGVELLVLGFSGTKARFMQFADEARWTLNRTNTGTFDDAAKSNWGVYLNCLSGTDNFRVVRGPPGAAPTPLLTLDGAGGLTLVGNLTGGGSLTTGTVKRAMLQDPNGAIADLGFNTPSVSGYNSASPGILWRLDTSSQFASLIRYAPTTQAITFPFQFDFNAGNLTISGASATKASGTTWANPSDRRLKDEIEDYATGLAAILQLQPRTFLYNGKGGSTAGMRGYGFIADEIAPILPETVGVRAGKLDAADEDETDIQTLDQSNLILALVNAVKELAARVGTLEGAAA